MIIFTNHAKSKLLEEFKKLGITERTVIQIVKKPDALLYDSLTNRFVAVNWSRNTAVIYEKNNDDLIIITVIYSSELRSIVNKRRTSGRWI